MAESAETKGVKEPYKVINPSTNAFGKYQLIPSQQGTRIKEFISNKLKGSDIDLDMYSKEEVNAFRNKLNRKSDANGYSDQEIRSYMAMMDYPKLQDEFAQEVLYQKDYKPNVGKVIAAYAKTGKTINEAQAIDLMHHYGVEGAKRADKTPRAWAASYQGENKKETQDVNNRIKNYNFAFQTGVSLKGVNTSLVTSTKHLIVKAGLDSLIPQVSSGDRNGNGGSQHDHGNAVDFKFNTPSQEMEAINKIAKMTANPEAARQVLLKGKGTSGNVPPLEIKVAATGQTLKIIYHADSDGSGNHLHIQL